jgi:MFS family permease
MIDKYEILCIGRFIYGLASGSFNVFGPLYITETAPIEIKGPLGALTELGISIGILIVFTAGLGIGDTDEDEIDSF